MNNVKDREVTKTIFNLVVLFGFLLLIALYLYTILFPYPIEFREGHMLGTTELLVKGLNPYSFNVYPAYFNSYGIVFNLVVWPFAELFGNTLVVHRAVNGFFILMILVVIYYYSSEFTKNNKSLLYLVLFIIANGLFFGETSTNRPDSLGAFLFLITLVIPIKLNFSKLSILLAAIFSILAFYTKVYFLIGWIALSVYVLLQKGFVYTFIVNILFGITFLFIAFIVKTIFPLYFYETIFAYSGTTTVLLSYSLKQFFYFAIFISPFILLFVYQILSKRIRYKEKINFNQALLVYCVVIILLLFFPLGINNGVFLNYHFQLLMPILGLLFIDSHIVEQVENRPMNNIFFVFFGLMMIAIFIYSNKLFKTSSKEWEKLEEFIKTKNNIYNDPIIAPLIIGQNKLLYNSGVSGFIDYFEPKEITDFLFGLDDEIVLANKKYKDKIANNLKSGSFDALIICERDMKNLDLGKYKQIDSVSIYIEHMRNYGKLYFFETLD